MTKQVHRMTARNLPVGEEGIERIRQIVKEKRYAKVNEVMVDLFSASIIIQVYDIVNDANKEKLRGLRVAKLADVCFAAVKNQRLV
jgi:hypothetical protein